MNRVVITGATGAVGHGLIQELVAQQVEIYAVCRPGSLRNGELKQYSGLHIIELDLADLKCLSSMIEVPVDTFYHLGWTGTFGDARNDMYQQNLNVQYSLDAVEVAHALGCNAFIGTGSQAEYGRAEGMLVGNTPAFPENGYGMAKLCAGQMTRVRCQELGLRHIWTRILSIYGPHDGDKTMVMSAVTQLMNKEIPNFTKGEQVWDYLYAKDLGTILYRLGIDGKDGKVYCLGSGRTRLLKEYIEAIRDAIDPTLQINIGAVPYNQNQVMYLCADVQDLVEDIAFEPAYSFEEGIRETIEWYRGKYENEEN